MVERKLTRVDSQYKSCIPYPDADTCTSPPCTGQYARYNINYCQRFEMEKTREACGAGGWCTVRCVFVCVCVYLYGFMNLCARHFSCMYLCVCVCVCVCTRTQHTSAFVCTYVCARACVCVCVFTNTHKRTRMHTHNQARPYIHTHMHTLTRTYVHTHI